MNKSLVFLSLAAIFFFSAAAFAQETGAFETEPNNTPAQADAAPLVISSNTLIAGSISPIGDVDVYKLLVASQTVVRFESFSSADARDCDATTTTIRLYSGVGTQLITDSASGIRNCSALAMTLAPGTYFIGIEETGNNAAIASYRLRVSYPPNAGAEIEPNDMILTATPLTGAPSYVFGDHSALSDSDFFAITLPVPGALRLEIIEGDRTVESCESNGIDSRLTLYNAAGTQLVDDDDEGRGFCSMIDGTGTTPVDSGARNLAAGTYFVQVRASTFATAADGQFIYRLVTGFTPSVPSAAGAALAGRVLDATGRAVSNATVTLTDQTGAVRTARANTFGHYRFEELAAGGYYTLAAAAKNRVFLPRVVNLVDSAADVDLVAEP